MRDRGWTRLQARVARLRVPVPSVVVTAALGCDTRVASSASLQAAAAAAESTHRHAAVEAAG